MKTTCIISVSLFLLALATPASARLAYNDDGPINPHVDNVHPGFIQNKGFYGRPIIIEKPSVKPALVKPLKISDYEDKELQYDNYHYDNVVRPSLGERLAVKPKGFYSEPEYKPIERVPTDYIYDQIQNNGKVVPKVFYNEPSGDYKPIDYKVEHNGDYVYDQIQNNGKVVVEPKVFYSQPSVDYKAVDYKGDDKPESLEEYYDDLKRNSKLFNKNYY